MRQYSIEEHDLWLSEVKELYTKLKSEEKEYTINFLNLTLHALPGVFSPKYFNNTEWYATSLVKLTKNKSLLEVGTGTGAIALYCCSNGTTVFATDITNAACDCARSNFERHKCKIPLFQGDLFSPLPQDLKVDYIFWNHPYHNAGEIVNDDLLKAGFDFQYEKLRKYIGGAHKYLKDPDRGLLLGTGGHADIETIQDIAKQNNYNLNQIDHCSIPLGKDTKAPNDFIIYELTKQKEMTKDDLWKVYSASVEWIKNADSKAILVVGISGIISTLFTTLLKFSNPNAITFSISMAIFFSAGFYTIISLLTAIYSLISTLAVKDQKKSNIFFKDISEIKNVTTYHTLISNNYNVEEDLSSQIYIISKIAAKKHQLLQWSVSFLGLAVIALVIGLISFHTR